MNTIARIHRDGRIAWDTIANSDERLLEDSGDVILNLREVWNSSQFRDNRILERWSRGWNFSLRGISVPDALHAMLTAFVFAAIADLVPELAHEVEPLRDAHIPDTALDGPLRDALDFPVRVNGRLLREFLCDVFDGPFTDDEALRGAILLRSAGVDMG